jgi:protein-disulfide isomerase
VRPELVENYVESGTLRIEWRDFPYQGQESVNAALAARAAQSQGAFWEYNLLLFENQSSSNSGGFSDENLVRLAEEAGLDTERFERDLASERAEQAVAADFEEGQSVGISGTPTFIVNGRALVGFQEADVFAEAIEDAEREANGESGGGESGGG